jgi:hypothetical protein
MRNKGMQIKSLAQKIIQIKKKYRYLGVMIPPPIGDEEINRCSECLTGYGFPPIPQGYAEFLKICNGYAFDGVELYGTERVKEKGSSYTLRDICGMTFNMHKEYGDEYELCKSLLRFGKDVCGDYLTYDDKTGNYQHRSHESFVHVYFQCDTFEEFFDKKIYELQIEEE